MNNDALCQLSTLAALHCPKGQKFEVELSTFRPVFGVKDCIRSDYYCYSKDFDGLCMVIGWPIYDLSQKVES